MDNNRSPNSNYGSMNSVNAVGRSSNDGECGYIEFIGKDGKTCPTCGGTGRIAKEDLDSLVALIPYNDNRLKPRRTKLYVTISILTCIVVSSIVLFFLFPRSVEIKQNGIVNSTVHINATLPSTQITFTYQVNISNANFFSIDVSKVDIQAYFGDIKVGYGDNSKEFRVPARTKISEFQTNVTILTLFDDSNNLAYVIDLCTNPKRHVHYVLLVLDATLSFSYMNHSEQTTMSFYPYIDCSPNKHEGPF